MTRKRGAAQPRKPRARTNLEPKRLATGASDHRGTGGRSATAFRSWCRSVLDAPVTRKAIAEIARDEQHPAHLQVRALLARFPSLSPEERKV